MPLMIRHASSVRLRNSNHQYCCSSSKDTSHDFIVKMSSAESRSLFYTILLIDETQLSRACLWYCIMYRPQQAYRCRCNTLCRLRSKPDPRLAQAKTEKFMGWADERNVHHGKNIQRSRERGLWLSFWAFEELVLPFGILCALVWSSHHPQYAPKQFASYAFWRLPRFFTVIGR